LLQLVPPITADGNGGFALVDATTNTAGERLFAYKAGSGDLMLLTVSRDGSFAFYSPDKPVPLPAIGTPASNWDFDSTALYVPAKAIYETTNPVTAQDTTAGSWTRTQRTIGSTISYSTTLFANSPRRGYVHRDVVTVTASNGLP